MTSDIGAAELGRSFDCKFPHCPNEARAERGQYAYCDEHRAQKAWLRLPRHQGGAAKAAANGGALTAELAKLQTLARNADKMRAKAATLTRQALAAKAAAEQAEQGYRDALREAVGDSA